MRDERGHQDSALRAALRAAAPEPPIEHVDWAALQRRVELGARPLLARRSSPSLLHLLGEWSWRGSLLAASAAAVLAILLGGSALLPASDDTDEFRTVEEELADALPIGARPLLSGAGESQAMLDAALFYDAEEW